jgi:hypothetical protein
MDALRMCVVRKSEEYLFELARQAMEVKKLMANYDNAVPGTARRRAIRVRLEQVSRQYTKDWVKVMELREKMEKMYPEIRLDDQGFLR